MKSLATTPAVSNAIAWKDKLVEYIINHSGALIAAVLIIIAGLFAARWIGRVMDRWMEHRAMEPPLRTLLVRVLRLLVFALAFVVALDTVGVDMTILIARF